MHSGRYPGRCRPGCHNGRTGSRHPHRRPAGWLLRHGRCHTGRRRSRTSCRAPGRGPCHRDGSTWTRSRRGLRRSRPSGRRGPRRHGPPARAAGRRLSASRSCRCRWKPGLRPCADRDRGDRPRGSRACVDGPPRSRRPAPAGDRAGCARTASCRPVGWRHTRRFRETRSGRRPRADPYAWEAGPAVARGLYRRLNGRLYRRLRRGP